MLLSFYSLFSCSDNSCVAFWFGIFRIGFDLTLRAVRFSINLRRLGRTSVVHCSRAHSSSSGFSSFFGNQTTPICSEAKPRLLLELPQIISYLNLKSLYSFSSANRCTKHCECSMEIKYDCRCVSGKSEHTSETEDDCESYSSGYSEYSHACSEDGWGCLECSNEKQCE
jgi:hypothetical protein